ncbi:2-oxo acid dehydrogenase subunit E2 [Aliiroseovarius sediminis]|uniref:2-oxo acid dehydrogenase subunit E2 n=1 Tax=Aliiroseovarius sediminis TaxID=2925839 RepID=UPI001F5AB858|nr:2-oxo acid dehydrogenase subunit E2 [Aliiroseovarius sediminis]MCI2395977.1 2-oxo acid dehydrogenase subunit E2 [Aliiroseovarius sediminis]
MTLDLQEDESGRLIYRIEGPQKAIADMFSANWPKTPVVHVGIAVNLQKAQSFRKQLSTDSGTRISLMTLIRKAAAEACKTHPIIAGLWEGEDTVILPKPKAIAVGGPVQVGDVAVPHLIEGASSKSLVEIAKEAQAVVESIRNGELSQETVEQSFQKMLSVPNLGISNIGMVAPVDFFIAMPVLPSVASLCVAAMQDTPIAQNGEVVIAPVARFYLSFDHRVLQAGPAAEFLGVLKEKLEAPETLAQT